MKRYAASIKAVLLVLAMAGALHAGTLVGQVQVVGSRSSADAVVYIDAIRGQRFEPPEEHATIDQQGLRFIPRVLPVLAGTTVDFLNSDTVLHNVFTPDEVAGRFKLGTYSKGTVRSHTFDEVGEAVILCNVHPQMEAYVVVLPAPYFAVTAEEGRYRIERVPAGTYTLKVWHKRWKRRPPQIVRVDEAGEVTVNFEIKRR